ncbi:MAG: replicative DNA helicase [Patescibacteria group bacterium]
MDRIPPHNLEAEQSLLGSLLVDPEAIIKIADMVRAEDFYKDAHKLIFEIIVELFERHEPIDLLTVSNRLDERGKLQEIGGRSAIAELANSVATSGNIAHYAKIVQKKATLRRILKAASTITMMGYDEEEDTEITLDKAEQTLFNVSSNFLKNSFAPIRSVLSEAFERIDELHRERGKLRGLTTGFTELDNVLAGLQKSDLIILAARPSVGKTSLALDIARNVAVKTKKPVGIFSLEMSKEQLVDRMICAEANIDLWRLRTGRLSDRDDEFPRIGQALGVLAEAPIFIDDSAGCTILEIRTKARRLQAEHDLGLIVIDYLQLMEGRGGGKEDNRVQEVSEISRGLKLLARELNIPVLCLSQLNRSVELVKPAIPKLAHLRESGSIEQDADVVLFIYRKAADKNYRLEDLAPEEKNLAEIHISKHRNGPTGVVKVIFDEKRACFRNMERRADVPSPSAIAPPPPPPPPSPFG